MANWQNAEYGPAVTLDLGITKVIVNELMAPQGEPIEYFYSFGNYRKSGFTTPEQAQAAAQAAVRRQLNVALLLLNSLETAQQQESEAGNG